MTPSSKCSSQQNRYFAKACYALDVFFGSQISKCFDLIREIPVEFLFELFPCRWIMSCLRQQAGNITKILSRIQEILILILTEIQKTICWHLSFLKSNERTRWLRISLQTSETFTNNLRCFETVTINKRLTTETPSTPSSRKFRSNRWSDGIGIEILEKFHKDNIQKVKLTRLFFR